MEADMHEMSELMAEVPSPVMTEEELEALYEEWCLRQEAEASAGHKDHHHW
jgi:hypothetical protein